jgi:hypothetical protein
VIDDVRWRAALAELPTWVKARCWASIGEVELEFDIEACRKTENDPADVRQRFFEALGGSWDIVDRRPRFKTVECRYKLRPERPGWPF